MHCARLDWPTMAETTWREATLRYRIQRELVTRARRAPFTVETLGSSILVIPRSGRPRKITERQWERSLPLLERTGRAPLLQASFNSSYIEAIVDDLRHA